MKIRQFTIKNYKSFGSDRNVVSDQMLAIRDVNMIFGYNNSGKSNLLKFLELVFREKINREIIEVEGKQIAKEESRIFWRGIIENEPYIFHKNNRENDIIFEFLFLVKHSEVENYGFKEYDELKKEYFVASRTDAPFTIKGKIQKLDDFGSSEIKLTDVSIYNKSVYRINATTLKPEYFFGSSVTSSLRNDSIAFANLIGMFNNCVILLDNDRYLVREKDLMSQDNPTVMTSGTFKSWLYNYYLNPQKNKEFKELVQFIKKYCIKVPANVINDFTNSEKSSPITNFHPEFYRIGNEIGIMLDNGIERLPIEGYGTGIYQLLYILARIFHAKNSSKIILIEELEMNLSPKYQSSLLLILRKLIDDGIIDQVFFTTHSDHFNFRADFSRYEVVMNGNGVSKVTRPPRTVLSHFFRRVTN